MSEYDKVLSVEQVIDIDYGIRGGIPLNDYPKAQEAIGKITGSHEVLRRLAERRGKAIQKALAIANNVDGSSREDFMLAEIANILEQALTIEPRKE